MWDGLRPEMELVSPALAGGIFFLFYHRVPREALNIFFSLTGQCQKNFFSCIFILTFDFIPYNKGIRNNPRFLVLTIQAQ